MKKLVLNLFILCTVLLCACGRGEETFIPELKEPADAKQEVQQAVFRRLYDVSIQDAGVVTASKTLRSIRSGVVAEIYVNFGDTVAEGQLILRLDDSEDLAAIHDAEEQLSEYIEKSGIEKRVLNDRIQMKQYEAEHSTGKAKSSAELELKALKLSETYLRLVEETELEELQGELEERKNAYGNYELYADTSGTVVYLSCAAGDEIQKNETLFVLADASKKYIETSYISESRLAGYDAVYARIGSEQHSLVYEPLTEAESKALIYAGGGLVTHFVPVEGCEAITAGEYCALIFISNDRGTVMTVPQTALGSNEDGSYVMVLKENEKVYRPVVTGQTSGGYTEITEGLAEGESVLLLTDSSVDSVAEDTLKLSAVTTGDLSEEVSLSGATVRYSDNKEVFYEGYAGQVTERYKSQYEAVSEGELLLSVSLSSDPIELLEAEIVLQKAEVALKKETEKRQKEIEQVGIGDEYEGIEELIALQRDLLTIELNQYVKEEEKTISVLRETYERLEGSKGTIMVTAPCSGFLLYVADYTSGDAIAEGAYVATIIEDPAPVLKVKDTLGVLRYNSEVTIVNGRDSEQTVTGRVICAADVVPVGLWDQTAIILADETLETRSFNINYTVKAEKLKLKDLTLIDLALLTEADGMYSARVYENGAVYTQYVSVGKCLDGLAWILKGLEPGQHLVTQ